MLGFMGAAANEGLNDDEGVWAWLGSIDDMYPMSPSGLPKLDSHGMYRGSDPTFTETNTPG